MTDARLATFETQSPYLYREGIASNIMESLTSGTLLIGIALILGATPFIIGLLGALPFLANILQIPAIFLVEKIRDRRAIVLWSCWLARLSLLGVALLYFAPLSLALPVFMALCCLRFMGGAVAGCAWNSWMHDLIPKHRLGYFFGRRMLMTAIAGAAVTFTASLFLDLWEQKATATGIAPYAVLFAVGFLFAVFSNAMIARLHHPPIRHASADQLTRHFTLRDLRTPLQHPNFRLLILFMSVWSFAVNLAAPFFAVFMLQSLHYSISDVIRLTILSQAVYVLTLRVWGHYSDRFSNKAIIGLCGPFFALTFLGWSFTTFPDPHSYTWELILALHVVMGASTSGINLATNNIALKLCPDDRSTSFLAVNSLCASFSAGIAPLLGGALIHRVQDVRLDVNLQLHAENFTRIWPTLSLAGWDFFFFLAFILSFVSLPFLLRIQEEGDVNRSVLLKRLVYDTARFIQNVSTVTGLRAQVGMPQPDNTSV